jgi:hypothetical protein
MVAKNGKANSYSVREIGPPFSTSTLPGLISCTKRRSIIFLVLEKDFSDKEVHHAEKTIYFDIKKLTRKLCVFGLLGGSDRLRRPIPPVLFAFSFLPNLFEPNAETGLGVGRNGPGIGRYFFA